MRKISIGKPWYSSDEIERIREVLDSGCWAGTCPVVAEFEKKFASVVGAKYAVAVSSATTGLHVALASCGIDSGEVIVADYTFPASAFAVMHAGAKPVLADIDTNTYCIDPGDITKKITEKTVAIMPVNQFGMPCDNEPIIEIAQENGLKIVWDSATGLGSEYKSKKTGMFPDAEVFSLYPTKILSTGEGGMITTNNKEIAEYAKSIVDFGKVKTEKGVDFDKLGYNYRMSAIHAAIGLAQLEKLRDFLKRRRELAEYYKKRINEEADSLYWLHSQIEPDDRRSAWQRFVCLVPASRDEIIAYMAKQGVECVKGNYALHQISFFREHKEFKTKCANSAFAYQHAVALPLHYSMTKEDVEYVIEKLKEFGEKNLWAFRNAHIAR